MVILDNSGWGGSVGYGWNFLLMSAFLSPNIWMALISEPLVRFSWIAPHWKTIICCCFQVLYVWQLFMYFWLTSAVLIYFRRNTSSGIFQPHSTSFNVFGILIGHQWVTSMNISQKGKKWGVNHAQGISSSKITGKMFFSKNLNNH